MRVWGPVVALWASACSAIVAPEDLPIRCSQDDACPKGQKCEDDECVPDDSPPLPDGGNCAPNEEPELCNGLDDDCDGEIDEGHDVDGDGVTWCNGGQVTGRDCNDQDPEETPGKTEVCDGRDNDCNGEEDDGVCAGQGQVCEPATGECVTRDCRDDGCEAGHECQQRSGAWSCVPTKNPDDCRDGSTTCDPGEVCNQQNGECVPAGELDQTCRNDAECAEELCVEPASLRMADGDSFCSRTCCESSDCPAGFVCWQPGGGFSACVSRTRLGLGDGDAGAGAACATDSDCASGACVGSACAEPCCEGADCGGQDCTISIEGGAEDPAKLVCGQGGARGPGWYCEEDSDCASLFCAGGFLPYCTAGCCGSDDCGDGFVCAYPGVDAPTEPRIRVCVEAYDFLGVYHGDEDAGSECDDPGECRSYRCDGGYCVDPCCSDADCPAGTTCRLSPVRDGGELLCQRDP